MHMGSVVSVADYTLEDLEVLLTTRISGREVSELSHNDINGDLHVVGVEVLGRLLPTEHVDHELQYRVRRRRLVVEDVHWILFTVEQQESFLAKRLGNIPGLQGIQQEIIKELLKLQVVRED